MKYTEKVLQIVKKAVEQLSQLSEQERQLDTAYNRGKVSTEDYKTQKAEIREISDQIRQAEQLKLQQAKSGYVAAVRKASQVDGVKLHEDARILQMDIKLTPYQFEALAEKHKDNPLMLQLLQAYGEKHEGLYAVMVPTATTKEAEFDGFISAAADSLRTPDSLKAAMFIEGHYTPKYCTEGEEPA